MRAVRPQFRRETRERDSLRICRKKPPVHLAWLLHPVGCEQQVRNAQTFIRPEVGSIFNGCLFKTCCSFFETFASAAAPEVLAPLDKIVRLGNFQPVAEFWPVNDPE